MRVFIRCSIVGCLAVTLLEAADVPPLVHYQGRLTDPAGTSLPDASVSLRFRIYDVESGDNGLPCGDTGANCLWEEVHAVSTRGGAYSVLLGSDVPLSPEIFGAPDRFMGIQVRPAPRTWRSRPWGHAERGADQELSPRQRMASVPYALAAPLSASVALTDQPASITGGWNLGWPIAEPSVYSARVGYAVVPGGPFNDRIDWLQCATFNFLEGSCGGRRQDPSMYAFSDQWEWTYRITPDDWAIEKNWDYTSASGEIHRYFSFFLDTTRNEATFAWSPLFGSTRALSWTHQGSRGDQDNRMGVNTTESSPGATLDVQTFLDGPTIGSLPGIQSTFTIAPRNAQPSSQSFSGLAVRLVSRHEVQDAQVGDLTGIDISLAADGDSNTGQTVGNVYGAKMLSGPFDGVDLGALQGDYHEWDLTGEAFTVDFASHIYIRSPLGPLGAGSTIGQLHGIFIEDLGGYSNAGEAITVAAQTHPDDGGSGNLALDGGEWNTGHLRIGSTHVWQEATGRLRVGGQPGAPTSGDALVSGTGDPTHGPAVWATPELDCTAACSSQGLLCQDAWSLGPASAAVGCDDTTSTRVCLCK